MSLAKTVKVEYHNEGFFYTVRGKRLKDLKSLREMRNRIMTVSNAQWKWHVVLTFNPKSLDYWFKINKDVGKALSIYFDKIRRVFWGVKYFWKYEEGTKVWCRVCNSKVDFVYDIKREGWVYCNICKSHIKGGDLPHYHLLFDFINRGIRSKIDKLDDNLKKIKKKVKQVKISLKMVLLEWKEKEYNEVQLKKLIHPMNWDNMNWKRWLGSHRKYKNNRNKSDLELLWGYWHYKKWNKAGIVYVREIRSYMDLKTYVKKDFFKYTEAKWLGSSKRKWSHSQNLIYEKGKGVVVGEEWVMVLETIGYFEPEKALEMVRGSKENMINYFNEKGMIGKYIYKRVIDDIMDMIDIVIDGIKIEKEKKQKRINVVVVGTGKCRYCEKEFNFSSGFVGLYCTKICFNAYGRSLQFRREAKEVSDKKDEKRNKKDNL